MQALDCNTGGDIYYARIMLFSVFSHTYGYLNGYLYIVRYRCICDCILFKGEHCLSFLTCIQSFCLIGNTICSNQSIGELNWQVKEEHSWLSIAGKAKVALTIKANLNHITQIFHCKENNSVAITKSFWNIRIYL